MSFRLKTIIGIAIIEAVLLFILIWSSMNFLLDSNEEELLRHAHTTATLFATTTKDAVLATDLASLESFVQEILNNPGVVYARVSGSDEGVLAQSGMPKYLDRPFVVDEVVNTVNDGVFDTFATITEAGVEYGRVEIGIETTQIDAVLASARRKTTIIAIIEMCLTALFSFILGTYLTRQLKSLKDASNRLAAGELGYQVVVSGSDELAQTAGAFNEMSRKLYVSQNQREQAEQELQRLNKELEHRVRVRTKKLVSLNKAVEYQALHDPLTRLPNRLLLLDRLDQALIAAAQAETGLALVLIDLKNFHIINDTLGRHVGDLALQQFVYRIQHVLPSGSSLARLRGDKFAAMIPSISNMQMAEQEITQILDAIKQPLVIADENYEITATAGYAFYPEDGSDAHTLMRHAEIAVLDAKSKHQGLLRYASNLPESDKQIRDLHGELANAIQHQQIILHFQPEVDFRDSHVHGVQALARWQHPVHGLIMPDEFIPVAEESGIIKALSDNILKLAIAQCHEWHKQDHKIFVSVQIAAATFHDPDFTEQLSKQLLNVGLAPNLLELLITENAIMLDPMMAMENLLRLHDIGVKVSVTDLASGFGHIAYLREMLIEKIRIDQSFVVDMLRNNYQAEVVHSIIGLAHSLDMRVAVDGVENETLWMQVKTLGGDYGLGYYISEPFSAENLIEWMSESRWAKDVHKSATQS